MTLFQCYNNSNDCFHSTLLLMIILNIKEINCNMLLSEGYTRGGLSLRTRLICRKRDICTVENSYYNSNR